ncbi:30S ribosomal protein S2 [Mycoplasmopsis agassizii]|uniref:Small ribosomal subunit protein uS2 n=1 Tax=Mycoplasmopsis agassizii TaxID=33922 RepID=A0A269TJZ1_9BACT|nr:30S ribosomal protein S2 [Mycoplasmopsis agassizii]PAK21386.1 30S ribosomal protein S2 [Mycoplasmopsis agassizii]
MENKNLNIEADNLVSNEIDGEKIVPNNLVLSAGIYFGHRTQNWNPKMSKFIHSKRKGIHIIDVSKSMKALELTYKIIQNAAAKGATFVFVGTKKHAKEIIKEEAMRSNSFFVSERWLGGTLTNAKTIFSQIKELERLENLKARDYDSYTKKEALELEKKLQKLQRNFEGIREMRRQPNFMIVVDPEHDKIAVTEARRKGVKIIGVVDTDGNPDDVDLAIPANDDSVKSIRLILTVLADAIVTAKGGVAKLAYKNDVNFDLGGTPSRREIDFNPNQQRRFFEDRRFTNFEDKPERKYHRDSNSANRPEKRDHKPATLTEKNKRVTSSTNDEKPATRRRTTSDSNTHSQNAKAKPRTSAPKKAPAKKD